MVGIITGEIGENTAAFNRAADVLPDSSPLAGIDWFGDTKALSRFMERSRATAGALQIPTEEGTGAAFGTPEPTEPMMPADAANSQYAHPGAPGLGVKPLKFDSAVPESVAQSLAEAKDAEVGRAYAAARSPSGFLPGVTRFGGNLAAFALDPLDIASAFVPVVGEARLAGVLGRAGIESAVAGRAAVGALRGVEAQLPIVGLRYGLSRDEQADYSATDAMADIVMGGLFGGGLHTLFGRGDPIAEAFSRSPEARIVEGDPAAREGALRASVAALAEDRPVDVANLIRSEAPGMAVEPPVPAGFVRMYHGGADYEGGSRWLTPDRAYAEGYAARNEGAKVFYVDVPENDPHLVKSFDDTGTSFKAPYAHFDAPEEIARGLKELPTERTEQIARGLQDSIAGSETARRAAGAPSDDQVRIVQQADAASQEIKAAKPPPDVPPTSGLPPEPKDLPALEAWAKAASQEREALVEGGPKQPPVMEAAERRHLDALDQAKQQTEGDAKMYEAAAQCMAERAT